MKTKFLIEKFYDDFNIKINVKVKNFSNSYKGFKIKKLFKNSIDSVFKSCEIVLSVYDYKILSKYLKSINFCSYLLYVRRNLIYGGTLDFDSKSIIISTAGSNIKWIVSALHHELSHLLIYHDTSFKLKWTKCNIKSFEYGSGGADALINKKDNTNHTVKSFKRGVVCQYGESSIFEDTATMVEYVMMNKKDFEKRALKYPVIKKKYKLLREFYKKLGVKI